MTLIIVDTTTFVDSWTCDSAHWHALFLKADAGEVRIGVPIVVLREFERRFLAKAKKDWKEFRRAEGKVRKLMPGAFPDSDGQEVDDEQLERLVNTSFADVRARLLEHAEILPLPSVSHQDLMDADLGRQKPFREDGKGYRDALIWHSLLEAGSASPSESVWIVTNNTTDFTRGEGDPPQLAPELQHQAEAARLSEVQLAQSLKSLIEALAERRPTHPIADEEIEFVDEIPQPGKEDVLLEEAIGVTHKHLINLDLEPDVEMRYGHPELHHELGILAEIESVTVSHVEVMSAACTLIDDDYEAAELWNVVVRAHLTLWGFAQKSDWFEVEYADNFWVDDRDWNDYMMSVEGEAMVDVTVSVLIDTSLYVLGANVESVEAVSPR